MTGKERKAWDKVATALAWLQPDGEYPPRRIASAISDAAEAIDELLATDIAKSLQGSDSPPVYTEDEIRTAIHNTDTDALPATSAEIIAELRRMREET